MSLDTVIQWPFNNRKYLIQVLIFPRFAVVQRNALPDVVVCLLVLPLMIDYNRSSVNFAFCDWCSDRYFIVDGKFYFWNIIFLTFYFYRQVIKTWNSKLSIWVIPYLWSIKAKIIDNIQITSFNRKVLIFYLFLHENICCGYSLEAPFGGTSNVYQQRIFSWSNKKNIIWIPLLSIWSYELLPGRQLN